MKVTRVYNFVLYLDEFSRVIKKTQQHQKFPFNFDSPFITRFFGEDKLKEIPYCDFTQLLEVSTCSLLKYNQKLTFLFSRKEHVL